MRKISLIAAASMLVLPALAQAKPLNELLAANGGVLGAKEASPAKVSYSNGANNGLMMDFGDSTLRSNLGLQSVFSFNDPEGGEDSTSFDVRNARLELAGSVMNGEFGWVVSNDFGSTNTDSAGSGSTLQDAYFDWNLCEGEGIRFGQFKTGYGHQWNVSYAAQQFIDRSNVTELFNINRQGGIAYFGNIGDFGRHSLGLFNGSQVREGNATEGVNTGGNDNKVMGVYDISFNLAGDYDRSYEGAPMGGDLSAGMGASVYYGQGDATLGDFASDFDNYGANVDLGLRSGEFSFQAEGFYAGQNWDQETAAGVDGYDNFGLYAQAGYFVVPTEWEVAGRFGWISFDDDFAGFNSQSGLFTVPTGVDNQYEINLVVSYYINGHNLKFQTGPSWVINQAQDDNADDTTDFRYQAGLMGHF